MIAARTKLGLEILAAALVLGVLGDVLVRATPWGLNVTVCAAALVATGVALVRRHRLSPSADAPWLALTVLLLGAVFMRRDAAVLMRFDVIALLVALSLGAASLHGERIAAMRPLDHLRAGFTTAVGTLTGSFVLVGHDVQWHELPRGGRARRVALGVLLAAPFLVLFGALFSSADTVFANVLQNLFAFDLESVVSHGVQIAFWGAVTAGYLRWGLLARPAAWTFAEATPKLGIVPVATALGLLNLLFLVFVIVQLRYFFGGAALVEETTGLTYSEYARRGFFELVTASGLVLPVLHGANHLVRGETTEHLRTFRRLAGILLVLLAVVMASALERMRLYVGAYGLSEDRLYATAFMVYLLGVFAWFAWTVLRGLPQRFAFGALIQGFVVLAGLHVLNPDAFIVRTNLNRPAAERPFDAKYALSLGADAVPPLLDALPSLPESEQCAVAAGLLARWGDRDGQPGADWRTWNWSRARTARLVREQTEALRAMSCETPAKEVL